jgi:hypothetical protein
MIREHASLCPWNQNPCITRTILLYIKNSDLKCVLYTGIYGSPITVSTWKTEDEVCCIYKRVRVIKFLSRITNHFGESGVGNSPWVQIRPHISPPVFGGVIQPSRRNAGVSAAFRSSFPLRKWNSFLLRIFTWLKSRRRRNVLWRVIWEK